MTKKISDEKWFKTAWRPSMAYSYIAICLFDFIIGPILNYLFFSKISGFVQWKPLTMADGGFFHMAMGAILGISAWTRGQEKLANNSSGADEK